MFQPDFPVFAIIAQSLLFTAKIKTKYLRDVFFLFTRKLDELEPLINKTLKKNEMVETQVNNLTLRVEILDGKVL